jgi:hypothetical protein
MAFARTYLMTKIIHRGGASIAVQNAFVTTCRNCYPKMAAIVERETASIPVGGLHHFVSVQNLATHKRASPWQVRKSLSSSVGFRDTESPKKRYKKYGLCSLQEIMFSLTFQDTFGTSKMDFHGFFVQAWLSAHTGFIQR